MKLANFNLQQQPKTRGYLQCFEADEGHTLIGMDFAALEPKVLAHYSQDDSMQRLYGKTSQPNDIYLYTGAALTGIKDKILPHYNPLLPTPESIAHTKKVCKKERTLCKIFVLAINYGAYIPKLQETLRLGGFDLTASAVRQMYNDYWKLYRGVEAFKSSLEDEWEQNNNVIMNGRNRPIVVDYKFKKDILNRFVQSTGHDVLMTFLLILNRLRLKANINMRPWIADFHDETIWIVSNEYVQPAIDLFNQALDELNQQLCWSVQMTGEVKAGKTLADFKCED